MTKKIMQFLSLLLCLSLLLTVALPVWAVETEQAEEEIREETVKESPAPARKLYISSAKDFLKFAENCRLDQYSRNLEVTLKADIDLRGTGFEGVPIFCGTFNGNYHTVTVEITAEGSNMGLFRYLTETALVRALHVEGTVAPQGSRCNAGGIAGINAGTVRTSSFSGQVSGADSIGGIVGINALSGIVENCSARGNIHGSHFVGGIAGKNEGVVRVCENEAQVNTTAVQNTVELSDITIDSLTGTEAANTVTDIGGIAGSNAGVIRSCQNHAGVGYRQMGYNIGGIAGSQTGYIVDCENSGEIHGRKEVGGIVGQMEPVARVNYDRDTLQILKEQVDEMSAVANRTASSAQGSVSQLNSHIGQLENQAENAAGAIGMLIPENLEDFQIPDEDTVLAAQNALSGSLSGMTNSLQSMVSTTESAIHGLNSNINALSEQMNQISQTINGASEHLGASIIDASDADTAENLTGKVENCRNYGNILADMNVGGIAGAMAPENDFDPEDDLEFSGELSLNFEGELRSVILDCESRATVTVKKQNGGGIVGRMALGLVKNCVSTGDLSGEGASYAGGIAGQSNGYLRSCGANMVLTAGTNVGGIAGSGAVVSDCHSMVMLVGGTEKLGAILGSTEETEVAEPIKGNYYLSMVKDLGAIDGISYAGQAEAMDLEEFLKLEGLSGIFRTVNVYFVYEDGTVQTVPLEAGSSLTLEQIPEVPEKAGYTGTWGDLAEHDLDAIYFDMTFQARYTSLTQTLESDAKRNNGRPLLLAQGEFQPEQTLTATESNVRPDLEDGQTQLESWNFTLTGNVPAQKLRYTLPENCQAEQAKIYVRNADGVWRQAEAVLTDSCLVFAVEQGDEGFSLVQQPKDQSWIYYAAAGGAAVLVFVAALCIGKKVKRKQTAHSANEKTVEKDGTM